MRWIIPESLHEGEKIQERLKPDSTKSLSYYKHRLEVLHTRLDSLKRIHQEISTQLEELRHRASLIKAQQQRIEIINGGILLLVFIVGARLLRGRFKKRKCYPMNR